MRCTPVRMPMTNSLCTGGSGESVSSGERGESCGGEGESDGGGGEKAGIGVRGIGVRGAPRPRVELWRISGLSGVAVNAALIWRQGEREARCRARGSCVWVVRGSCVGRVGCV